MIDFKKINELLRSIEGGEKSLKWLTGLKEIRATTTHTGNNGLDIPYQLEEEISRQLDAYLPQAIELAQEATKQNLAADKAMLIQLITEQEI